MRAAASASSANLNVYGLLLAIAAMDLYRPKPTAPGDSYDCLGCGTEIDGCATEGFWLERDRWQAPNTYELYCLSCCVETMTDWPNHPDVDDEAAVKAHFE